MADIKKDYIENLVNCVKLCEEIDKVVLFGSSLNEYCTEISDVDIAVFGRYSKAKMFRLKSYNDFMNAVTSYGKLQDYDVLYFKSEKNYNGLVFQDIKKGAIIYERT